MAHELVVESKPVSRSFKREHPWITGAIALTVTTLSISGIGVGLTIADQKQKAEQPLPENGLKTEMMKSVLDIFGERQASITSDIRNDLRDRKSINDAIAIMERRNCPDILFLKTDQREIRVKILNTPANADCH